MKTKLAVVLLLLLLGNLFAYLIDDKIFIEDEVCLPGSNPHGPKPGYYYGITFENMNTKQSETYCREKGYSSSF